MRVSCSAQNIPFIRFLQALDVLLWPVPAVCHWLTFIGLGKYAPEFNMRGIDGNKMLLLDNSKMKVSISRRKSSRIIQSTSGARHVKQQRSRTAKETRERAASAYRKGEEANRKGKPQARRNCTMNNVSSPQLSSRQSLIRCDIPHSVLTTHPCYTSYNYRLALLPTRLFAPSPLFMRDSLCKSAVYVCWC